MKTELFDYELPEELIAVRPSERRDGARLLVVDRTELEHRSIGEWPELVPEGALVVLNDTRVRRARVFGQRQPGGGRVELFLLKALASASLAEGERPQTRPSASLAEGERPQTRPSRQGNAERWAALGRANKPLKPGTLIEAGEFSAEVEERSEDGVLTLAVHAPGGVETWLGEHGHVPIPPYLRRQDEAADLERYQTVYARRTASVAAPTAGLHLTEELLRRLEARGIEIAKLELEVGLGTFLPVQVDDLDQHPMHAERIDVSPPLARSIADKRRAGAPIVAVGTTVVRALESAADAEQRGQIRPRAGETRLLIQPGYDFRVVDAVLTNFHQPRSTLLALVSAFAGIEAIRSAYSEAVRARYRFLSYGDAMWIARRGR